MTTFAIKRWRAFPQVSLEAWLRDLLGLKPLRDRASRIQPVGDEAPSLTIQRAKDAGFAYCTDRMVDWVKQNTKSEIPGFVIFPMAPGRYRILRVCLDGSMDEVAEKTFKFTQHPRQWTIAMVRPATRKA